MIGKHLGGVIAFGGGLALYEGGDIVGALGVSGDTVIRFKSLAVALKEIEPMVRDLRHVQTGKPLEKFGDMRPREMLANWLLCATFETIENRKLMFYSDPVGGGVIRDEATGHLVQTEHVYVSQHSTGPNAKTLILDAI